MTKLVQRWLDKGQWTEVNGYRVFYLDSGGNKPVLCILHGFPTSTLDYYKALPFLEKHFRVIMHDHLGFGASDKPQKYSYSFIEQTDIAIQLWKKIGLNKISIFAHDYGTSIATELMARQNITKQFNQDNTNDINSLSISGYILSNGSVHTELAKLRFIQKLLRRPILGPWIARLSRISTFERNYRAICYDKNAVSKEDILSHWSLLIREEGKNVLAKISQYTREREKFWYRWTNALKESSVPVDLIWARNDPIARPIIATTIQKECPISQLKWIDNCGHFPMVEKPEEWAESLIQQLTIRASIAN